MKFAVRCVVSAGLFCLISHTLFAEDKSDVEKVPPALQFYKGRRIAQTMHFNGAPWLIRENRENEERCSIMLANLGVKPGMTICDMGCGNGFYSLQMAKMVAPDGKVLGVDIQPEMLRLLRKRASKAKVRNIEPILGTLANPKLPEGEVDLILCVDVYHEFSHPEQMLSAMRKSLKPKGVVALLEYRSEDPDVPIKLLHKMSKAQIMKEYPANGFKLVRQYDKLPWQHMMFFARDDSPLEEVEVSQDFKFLKDRRTGE
jgi:ubiquinone/menaquinone biosynthesis C-methylase UbiE